MKEFRGPKKQLGILGSIIGGVLGLIGANSAQSAANAAARDAMAFGAGQTEVQRQFAHGEAKIARDWSEYMSNTAWQRGMADMRAKNT